MDHGICKRRDADNNMQDDTFLEVANAKARFESMHYYLKTSHSVEVCAYKGDPQNAAVVAAQPVLFMLDEKQCAKAVAAQADFRVNVGKQLLAEATTSAKCAEGKIEIHIVGPGCGPASGL